MIVHHALNLFFSSSLFSLLKSKQLIKLYSSYCTMFWNLKWLVLSRLIVSSVLFCCGGYVYKARVEGLVCHLDFLASCSSLERYSNCCYILLTIHLQLYLFTARAWCIAGHVNSFCLHGDSKFTLPLCQICYWTF